MEIVILVIILASLVLSGALKNRGLCICLLGFVPLPNLRANSESALQLTPLSGY